MSAEAIRTRMDELLADRALVGLSPREELELERLASVSGAALDPGYDLAAASIGLALAAAAEPVPAAVRARLDALALEFSPAFRSGPAARPSVPAPAARPLPRLAGWLVAAAALVVALFAWRAVAGTAVEPAELRAELVARADALQLDWTATELAPGASGDVVWSQAEQAGVLRIRGLAANDPAREQYQLWIFDEAQEHPIDGGVFDVSGGEALVPIDAKLPVGKATLFAVTREKPGGVVVSDRQRIVLLAQG
jgi:anti-sigma-K factor RskA